MGVCAVCVASTVLGDLILEQTRGTSNLDAVQRTKSHKDHCPFSILHSHLVRMFFFLQHLTKYSTILLVVANRMTCGIKYN